jgi:hypothetical protein
MTGFVDVSMFVSCPLPACENLVDEPGRPCPECVAAFGDMLQMIETDRTRDEVAAVLDERDQGIRDMLRAQRETKELAKATESLRPKQRTVCWICERERRCVQEPQGWECRECRQVTA